MPLKLKKQPFLHSSISFPMFRCIFSILQKISAILVYMFRFTVIAIGKIKNPALAILRTDFSRRLKRYGRFEEVELKDSSVENEGRRILDVLEKQNRARHVYALAEEGETRSSVALARELHGLGSRSAIFIVGGAYGLSPSVKVKADTLLSLSPLTFTHEIARMLLCEQLYRAVSIHAGSKYHHE